MRTSRIRLAATAVCGALALSGLTDPGTSAWQRSRCPSAFFSHQYWVLGDGANLGPALEERGCGLSRRWPPRWAPAIRTWQAYLVHAGPRGEVNVRREQDRGRTVADRGGPAVMARQRRKSSLRQLQLQLDRHAGPFPASQTASRIDGDPDFTLHDVLTGTRLDGTPFPAARRTARAATGPAMATAARCSATPSAAPSRRRVRIWNTAHPSRGCSEDNLFATASSRLFYCFAID